MNEKRVKKELAEVEQALNNNRLENVVLVNQKAMLEKLLKEDEDE